MFIQSNSYKVQISDALRIIRINFCGGTLLPGFLCLLESKKSTLDQYFIT